MVFDGEEAKEDSRVLGPGNRELGGTILLGGGSCGRSRQGGVGGVALRCPVNNHGVWAMQPEWLEFGVDALTADRNRGIVSLRCHWRREPR